MQSRFFFCSIRRGRPGPAGVLAAVLVAVFASSASAMPPAELQQRLARGDKLTIIDVRPAELYEKGHIPGAINIPAAVVSTKRLPALGEVVVYGEGLGRDSEGAATALAEFNRKPGIRALGLDGGYAAWEAAGQVTTAGRGMRREEITFITYDQLKRSQEPVVLVDLRSQARFSKEKAVARSTEPLTDLRREFPGRPVIQDPLGAPTKAKGEGVEPVMVLIDRNDGTSEDVARQLRQLGRSRVVVLVGGEEMIVRKGRPGLERVGPGSGSDTLKTGPSGLNK